MKRLLLVLLLLAVPFQITWAAVGAYCQHEAEASSKHFGHHPHQHRATAGDEAKGSPVAKLHSDCSFCSMGGVGVTAPALAIQSSPATVAVHATDLGFLASAFHERLERPKWASGLA